MQRIHSGKAGSSTWVENAKKTSAVQPMRCFAVWGLNFRINQTKTGVNAANTKRE